MTGKEECKRKDAEEEEETTYTPAAADDDKMRFVSESLIFSVLIVIEQPFDDWEVLGTTFLWVES